MALMSWVAQAAVVRAHIWLISTCLRAGIAEPSDSFARSRADTQLREWAGRGRSQTRDIVDHHPVSRNIHIRQIV